MWFFYFLPMLVAIGFILARIAWGGPLTLERAGGRSHSGYLRS